MLNQSNEQINEKIVVLDFSTEEDFEEVHAENIQIEDRLPFRISTKSLWMIRLGCLFFFIFQCLFFVIRLLFCPLFLLVNIFTFFSYREFVKKLYLYKIKFAKSLRFMFIVFKAIYQPNRVFDSFLKM